MTAMFGDLLPLAVVIAISPLPIIAAILTLLSPHARRASLGFLVGWVVGIFAVTAVVAVLAVTTNLTDGAGANPALAWLTVIAGLALVLLAVKQWRARPRAGETPTPPSWQSAIDSFGFARAAGLGLTLSAVNPKNLLMSLGAGVTVGTSDLNAGEQLLAIAEFTVIAASSVAALVLSYLIAADRISGRLEELRKWLEQNNAAVMTVVLLLIGVVVIGKGLQGI